MARVEVITGAERRRRWSAEQKRAIVAESLAPGAVVRRLPDGPIFIRGRSIAGVGRSGSVAASPVLIAPAGDGAGCPAAPAIELEFAGKVRLRIPASIPAGLAAAVVKALSGQ